MRKPNNYFSARITTLVVKESQVSDFREGFSSQNFIEEILEESMSLESSGSISGGVGIGVGVGNYKGVMLCNRPFGNSTGLFS